ncbi:MAG TPA: GNAT family N-acetyltransferase [Thermoanaerobaculia bacterium]
MLAELSTPRLLLRTFDESDLDGLTHLVGAREVASTTLEIPHPYTREMAEAWLRESREKIASGESVSYAIVAESQLVGSVGLKVKADHARAELGYWIGLAYWGRGYATEAARAMLEYGFDVMGLNRIFAGYFPRNPASGRVLEKIGMKRDGVLRQHVMRWGVFEDVILYSMLRSERTAQR